MSASEEVVLDDGTVPRTFKVSAIIQGIESARKVYANCKSKKSLCYAAAVGELIRAFGSLAANLIYDEELTSFIVKLADGRLLLYDATTGVYKILPIPEVVKALAI